MIILVVIVLLLVRLLRPYYRTEARVINGEAVESVSSDHLHVHLAVALCAIIAMSHECS